MNTFTPAKVTTEVKKIASSFIWEGKKSKIAYSTIIQPTSGGGLKVMDLESQIKVYLLSWIRKILNNPECTSAEVVRSLMGGDNLSILLGSKYPIPSSASSKSPFYAAMLKVWSEVHDFAPTNEENIRGEIIWNN